MHLFLSMQKFIEYIERAKVGQVRGNRRTVVEPDLSSAKKPSLPQKPLDQCVCNNDGRSVFLVLEQNGCIY